MLGDLDSSILSFFATVNQKQPLSWRGNETGLAAVIFTVFFWSPVELRIYTEAYILPAATVSD